MNNQNNIKENIVEKKNNDNAKNNDAKNNSSMKNLFKAVVFCLLFLVILVPLTYMLRMNGDVKDRFTGFYAEPKNSLDVVLIGSSPTYSSCSTPQLYGEYGIKAYPLATNVQRPVAGLYLVKEAQKTQSPKLYMFEMRMYSGLEIGLINNMAYTRGVTDNMKYSLNRFNTINAMVPELNERYTYYFDIFKYHSNWKTLVLPSQWATFNYKHADPMKGTIITDKVGPAVKPVIKSDISPVPIEDIQERALDNLLDYLQKNNLNALFYLSPYQMKDDDQEKYLYISNKIEAAGFNFLDMNQYYDELELDFETDFSDYGIHTNALGEKKCTAFLGQYLRDNYDLPDYRLVAQSDSSWQQAYEAWNEAYADAEVMIAQRIENEDWTVIEE